MSITIAECPVCELEPAKRERVEEVIWGDKPWRKPNRRSGYRAQARAAAGSALPTAAVVLHADHCEAAEAGRAAVIAANERGSVPDEVQDDLDGHGYQTLNRRAAAVAARALRAIDIRMASTEAEDGGAAAAFANKDLMAAATMGLTALHSEARLLQSARQDSRTEAFLAALAERLSYGPIAPGQPGVEVIDVTPAYDARDELLAERKLLAAQRE